MSSNPKNLPATAPPARRAPEPEADPAAALAKLLEEFGPQALAKVDEIARAFKIAEGVTRIRALVKAHVQQVMPLQGSALGFKTDKDSQGGYGPDAVAECATEALLRGLRLTGNEWNIIGGRCYVAQAGCARLVAELPGVTDLELSPGIPLLRDGGAIVEYAAAWKLDGKPMSLSRKIPVRVNNGMGADAILGKAKRKMLAAIYERLTGSVLSEGEADDPAMIPPAPPKTSQLAGRLAAGRPAPDVDQHGNPLPPASEEPGGNLFDNQKRATNLPD